MTPVWGNGRAFYEVQPDGHLQIHRGSCGGVGQACRRRKPAGGQLHRQYVAASGRDGRDDRSQAPASGLDMGQLDREFLERLGATLAQLKMLATLHKRGDLLAEVQHWEQRRQVLLSRGDRDSRNRIVNFPSDAKAGE